MAPERQDQQNVRKLRGLNPTDWARLVDLIARDGNLADMEEVRELVKLDEKQGDVEAFAARANMTAIVKMLHDPSSQLMDMLIEALSAGKLCIVDVSQLRGGPSLILSGLILRKIFDHNQEEFTKADARTIPTIAVVEEAQSVLNEKASASTPYIEWVKEGRKYDLGAVLITQQPGSIPTDILSQGDNWFIFHLLSATDLNNVNRANAHFSDDILSSLLNEPIAGQGVFWSGVSGMSFPISLRVLSFSHLYKTLDSTYNRPAVSTYASELRERFHIDPSSEITLGVGFDTENDRAIIDEEGNDLFRQYQKQAINALARNEAFRQNIESNGIPWGVVIGMLKETLPSTLTDRDSIAYNLVSEAMNEILGPRESAWATERRGPKSTLFIVKTKS